MNALSRGPARAASGFTLLELIVTLAVISTLSAVAVPTFQQVSMNAAKRVVNTMLESSARAGEASCLASNYTMTVGQVVAAAADGLDANGANILIGGDSITITVRSGRAAAYGSVVFSSCQYTILPAQATLDGLPTGGEGVFYDAANDTSFERDSDKLTIRADRANWEHITVTYDLGSGSLSDQVFKTSGPSVVGALERVSNTVIVVNLPVSAELQLTIKFNGRSSGTIYVFSGS